MGRKLTKRQLALIHIAKQKLDMDDREYRHALLHFTGVESSKELDQDGLDVMMGYFEYLGFAPVRPPDTKNNPGHRPGMATPAQLDYIRDMWRRYKGEWDTGLNGWLQKSYGVSALRFLDSETAGKAITGLKAMANRPKAKKSA